MTLFPAVRAEKELEAKVDSPPAKKKSKKGPARKKRPRRSDVNSPKSILADARRLAGVRHPNVMNVLGAAENDRSVGVWYEPLDAVPLRQWLRESGPASPKEASRILVEVARGLGAIHQVDLIHGDLSAKTICRTADGRIVITDFGPNRRSWEGSDEIPEIVHAAPESLRGDAPDSTSDVYSLGVLLFELLTREFPYAARSRAELLAKISSGEVRRLSELRPELPPVLSNMVDAALARKRTRRLSSPAEFAAELREIAGIEDPPPRVATPAAAAEAASGISERESPESEAGQRSSGRVVFVVVAIAIAAAAAYWFFLR